jgi:hypothetical protein
LLILGIKGEDRRFYISGKVISTSLPNPIKILFLVDTGANLTQLSWNDAEKNGINIRNLPEQGTYTSSGGNVKYYSLPNSNIIFNGLRDESLNFGLKNLTISDSKTVKGESTPRVPSVVGIDFLKNFTILFDNEIIYLKKNVFLRKK